MRFPSYRATESIQDAFNGRVGRHFSQIGASHSVRNYKKPAVRPHALGCLGLNRAKIVLVSNANAAKVSNLSEFQIHIGR